MTFASAAKRVDRRARRPPPGVLAVFTHPVFPGRRQALTGVRRRF
ncbi:hypothetical protein OHB56_18585 [Streptomyces sp. NBC_01635]|nr:hypothetical protein OHB56_18585 [Streptomyces sp. NBC_01635]